MDMTLQNIKDGKPMAVYDGGDELNMFLGIAFLAGPDSCYFSGQSVIVDGANSIMP